MILHETFHLETQLNAYGRFNRSRALDSGQELSVIVLNIYAKSNILDFTVNVPII